MTHLRTLSLSILLACCTPLAAAADRCHASCQGLIREANALAGQGKIQQALEKYKAAEQAAPQASLPLSSAAALLLNLAPQVKPEQATGLRNMARALATRAAGLEPEDPVAQEALRMLDDDAPSPLRAPGAKAAALLAEAEALFAQHRLKDALQKYEAAIALEPQLSIAWVGAGDCHYLEKDYARAEVLFRRATEIEPRNSQAWRFLSDALLAQGKHAAAESTLYSAIAADPSQRPNWGKLAQLRARAGLPLAPLALRRGVRVLTGADGKYTINLDSASQDKTPTPDHAVRLALGITEANIRTADKAKGKSAWEIELEAWRTALKISEELGAKTGDKLSDPALLKMQVFARDGQLEPALLLLQFRQAYRPALEAWLAARPNGVKEFIDRYGVQP